ncbi:MAG TPA: serine/threonine-protein kinase [Gemmatimonadaceae bacterium]|nr:serine/threonine-protein kinase [Gemmatimonadaceae bacterium]
MPKTPQPPQRYTAAESTPLAPPPDPIASLRAALRGHYEFERELGQGAFATVYLARDLKHERKVAIKVLHADPNSEMGELRFIREIRMLARLQHPNILPLHDSGHVETLLYYVMPYVSGETLRDRIDRERQLSADAACNIARDIADALSYAHQQGIIHRDIKPENILLSAGHPMLADFGIARVIDIAGVKQLTRTGMGSPGTPAYMSPEQLLGDREVDGRSDTYSLGCVLFEMLTGKPPFAGKDGFVKRFTESPPVASSIRKDAPVWMDRVVETALARNPAERFQTAQEFADALTAQDHSSSDKTKVNVDGTTAPSDSSRLDRRESFASTLDSVRIHLIESVRSHTAIAVAAVAVLTLSAAAYGVTRTESFRGWVGAGHDSTKFVVLPFSGPGGSQVAANLYDRLAEWRGLKLVADTRVTQAIGESGTPLTEAQVISVARALGAGKVVWGTVTQGPDPPRIRVYLYDTQTRETKDDFLFGSTDSRAAALRLMANGPRPDAASGCDVGTISFAAWSSCVRAHVALKNWDVAEAEKQLRLALSSDPDYGSAHLWLAQLLSWQPSATSSWQSEAFRAASSPALASRDRQLADALTLLGNRAFPAACEKYRAMTRADSSDFVAWYGLGECQVMDSVVVPSRASPSNWSFRSSYRAAAYAYERAIRLSPGARAVFDFEKLHSLLPTAATKVRIGKSEPPHAEAFLASPSFGDSDTLGFIPYPAAAFADKPPSASATLSLAIAKDAEELLTFATEWVSASGQDPNAYEALADMLEVHGDISDETSPLRSALAAIREGVRWTSDSSQLFRFRTREVWIRFKRGEFATAKQLSDSLIAAHPRPSLADAQNLIGLVALTGRATSFGQLAAITGAGVPDAFKNVPDAVNTAAAKVFARAALGLCGSPVDEARTELNDALDRYVAPAAVPSMKAAILARPLTMLGPCTGGRSTLEIQKPRDRIARMQQALARGDRATFLATADSITARTSTRRPGDLSPDFLYQQAWLRAAFGDTASAVAQLDRWLRALPGLSPPAMREAGSAAAIVRAMMLRADIAAARGDNRTAQKWAGTVSVLWSGADTSLQSELQRMKTMQVKTAGR